MVSRTCFTVRFMEIDKMGIAYHSNYLKWFERGRTDYLKNAGIFNFNSKIIEKEFFLPLTKIELEFKSPARYGDELTVITNVVFFSSVKVKFEYRLLNNKSGKLLAVGRTVHAWTDRNIQPLNIEKTAPEVYRKLREYAGS